MVFKYSKKYKKNLTFKDIVYDVEKDYYKKKIDTYNLRNNITVARNAMYNGWVVHRHSNEFNADKYLFGGEGTSLHEAKKFALGHIKKSMRTK